MNRVGKHSKITTSRLVLRPVAADDLESIHSLHLLPESNVFNTIGAPNDKTITAEWLKEWIRGNELPDRAAYTFAIIAPSGNEFIGLLALNLRPARYSSGEVWFKLFPEYWGQGYATEALKLIIKYSFDILGIHRIEAGCAVGNKASIRVLEKAGMRREGQKRQALPLPSGWSDNYEYAILKGENSI